MGLVTGGRGRASWDCTKFAVGCLVEETKVGRGGDIEVVWGESSMEIRGKRRENGLVTCKQLLLSTLVWPRPLPDQHSLSHFLIKLHFFLRDSLLLVQVVHIEVSNWSQTVSRKGCTSVEPTTGMSEGLQVGV